MSLRLKWRLRVPIDGRQAAFRSGAGFRSSSPVRMAWDSRRNKAAVIIETSAPSDDDGRSHRLQPSTHGGSVGALFGASWLVKAFLDRCRMQVTTRFPGSRAYAPRAGRRRTARVQ
jgi:hypothetical protein